MPDQPDLRIAIISTAFRETVQMWEGVAAYLIPQAIFDQAAARAVEALDNASRSGGR